MKALLLLPRFFKQLTSSCRHTQARPPPHSRQIFGHWSSDQRDPAAKPQAGDRCFLTVFSHPPHGLCWGRKVRVAGRTLLVRDARPLLGLCHTPSAKALRPDWSPYGKLGFGSAGALQPDRPSSRSLVWPRNPHWPGQASLECSLDGQLTNDIAKIRRRKHTPSVVHVFSSYLCEETY